MQSGLAALRLLVVDDNPQMRTIIGTVLSAAGVRHLHYARDGRRGLEAIAAFRPDVVYVDYEMPVLSGLDFISAVRRMEGDARFLPIIMLTGHSDLPRLTAARDRGVTEFLGKPASARAILSRLQAAIYQPRTFVDCTTYVGPCRRRLRLDAYRGPFRRATDPNDTIEI